MVLPKKADVSNSTLVGIVAKSLNAMESVYPMDREQRTAVFQALGKALSPIIKKLASGTFAHVRATVKISKANHSNVVRIVALTVKEIEKVFPAEDREARVALMTAVGKAITPIIHDLVDGKYDVKTANESTIRPKGETIEVYTPKGATLAMEVIEDSDGFSHYITVDSSGRGAVTHHKTMQAAIDAVDKSIRVAFNKRKLAGAAQLITDMLDKYPLTVGADQLESTEFDTNADIAFSQFEKAIWDAADTYDHEIDKLLTSAGMPLKNAKVAQSVNGHKSPSKDCK